MNLPCWAANVKIGLETDCKAANDFLTSRPTNLSWQGQQILLDLRQMSHPFVSILFSFAPRTCNMVAHNLAKKARSFTPTSWMNEPPLWLNDDLLTDNHFCNLFSVT